MKKLLTLLSILCLGLAGFAPRGFAQNKASIKATITHNGQSYAVTTNVPKGYYANTSTGQAAFNASVKNGVWRLTTVDGCVIPAGTKPPTVKPTCSSGDGPVFASATYSFNPNSLTVNATVSLSGSDNVKMRFENADGSAFSVANPGGVLVNNNDYYFGSNPTANTRQWIVNFPSASAKKVTIRRESDQSVFSKTFTPANGASNVNLFTATSTTVTQPPSQTVAGSFSFQVPAQETSWDGFDNRGIGNQPPHGPITVGNYFKQENDRYILYVNEGHGGLATIYDKTTSRWLINRPDQGRGDGYSSYSGPDSYDDDAPYWHTKYNPLKNGDAGGHGTPISFKSKITIDGKEYLYARSDEMLSWSHVDSRKIKMKYEQWSALTTVNGTDIVDIHTRLTHNRDDLTDYGPFLQEWALMMVNGQRLVYFYNGDSPYTNDNVRATDGFEKIVKNSQNQDVWITPGKPMPVSEPWIGVDIGSGRMLAHYSKTLYYPSFNLMDGPEGADSDGGKTGQYTSGHMMDHLDPKRQWKFDDTWILGSLAQVRAFVYAQPRASKPDYYFNQTTGRAGWVNFDNVSGPQEPFSVNTGWLTSFDGKTDNGVTSADNCKLRSPYTSFKASDCPTLYVKGKLSSTGNNAWKINYTYVGQEVDGFEAKDVDGTQVYAPNQAAIRVPKGVRPQTQFQSFTMQPDNVERVYAIPMNWTGTNYIHQIEIQQNAQQTQGGAKLNLTYVGCTQP